MKRHLKSMSGVTLLEIMLVLAIAAMIIVMSIRYYQSATNSQQANAALQQIQAITAGMDNLAVGSGAYTNITTSQLTATVGSNNMVTPSNQSITLSGQAATTYNISMPLSTNTCPSVLAKVASNSKITGAACAGGTLSYTYDSTK